MKMPVSVDFKNISTKKEIGPLPKNDFGGNVKSIKNIAIPKVIHHFWQGDINGINQHINNLENVAKKNPSYKIKLHLLPNNEKDCKLLQSKMNNVQVKDLNKEKWFSKFKKTERFQQFEASRNGERKHLASGADIIKSELLVNKGGVWNDVDNPPLAPLPKDLSVSENGILTAGPVAFKQMWGGDNGFHSSTLATHKNNESLKVANKASLEKFKELRDFIYQANENTNDPDMHFKMISETAGSLHLSREILKQHPDMAKEIESLLKQGETIGLDKVIMDKYFKPTSTTGFGGFDDAQLNFVLESLGGPGHVIV